MRYLYGASVQGIQGFIFETDKLQEIAGASELVEQICTDFFEKCVGKEAFKEDHLLIGAAGNIKYVFDTREECQKLVYDFPKKVMEFAPGITLSQAVVEIDSALQPQHMRLLEKRLQTQRNAPVVRHGLGLMVSERSRRTGNPGVNRGRGEILDSAQRKKRKAAEQASGKLLSKLLPGKSWQEILSRFPLDMEDLAGGETERGWIAVIHADGNDLGKKIVAMTEEQPPQSAYRDLSLRLEAATNAAAAKAFSEVIAQRTDLKGFFPFRPIILGGDDLTVIVRAEFAVDFTHVFLAAFESETREKFKDFAFGNFASGLTACAGIAFIKPNYPFHYGVHLADMLCAQAKKVAKTLSAERTPACLLFYKVHSSFIEDFDTIVKQELTTKGEEPKRLDYGPYFLQEHPGFATIQQLKEWVKILKQVGSPRSRLRNWLRTLQINTAAAAQDMQRIKDMTSGYYVRSLTLDKPFAKRGGGKEHTLLFDAISLSSIAPNDHEDDTLSN